MVLHLVTRSVVANRDRSIFLLLSLALSAVVLVVGASLVLSLRSNIITSLKDGFAGDIQGFHADNRPLRFTAEVPIGFLPIQQGQATMDLLRRDPDVRAVAPRSNASSMILTPDRSAPAVLVGLDPRLEADTLSRLQPTVKDPGLPQRGILLGRPMANRLLHGSSQPVTVLIPTADGLFDGDEFEVMGTYSPPGLPLIDEFVAFVHIDHLQMLLGEQAMPRSVIIRLRDSADVTVVRQRLQQSLDRAGLPVRVWTWRELAGDLLGIARIGDVLMASGLAFLLLVVILGVSNVCLVLMFEKTREIGLMRALGTSRLTVFIRLVAEIGLTSVVASAVGTLTGAAFCRFLGRVGIPAVSQAMTYAFGGERLYPGIGTTEVLLGFVVVAMVGPCAALWPALRCSATDPALAMRSPE